MLTYTVFETSGAWAISDGNLIFPGYTRRTFAIEAARRSAEKVCRTGRSAEAAVMDSKGARTVIWADGNDALISLFAGA